tara:strand:+ start:708 stop:1556 length:849 start_codon:yes stop_codon:yes gene_type:complete
MTKITFTDILNYKKNKRKIVAITSYDYPTAKIADNINIDIILVGDSGGTVVLGHQNITSVTLDEIKMMLQAVNRGVQTSLIVVDMPYNSYNTNIELTLKNANELIKLGANAVKLEGGIHMQSTIKKLVDSDIPVMGHIGLTPQTTSFHGKYQVQGKTKISANKILNDAYALQNAGVFSIVLELVTSEIAQIVTESIDIPTIGIGSGINCDGQILVLHDMIGLYDEMNLKFVKKYANIKNSLSNALKSYKNDVISSTFPSVKNTFYMSKKEYNHLIHSLNKKN